MSDLYAYSSDSSSDTSDGESTTTMPTSIIKDNGGMLPVPFRRTIKAGVLYQLIMDGHIDTSPAYQRGSVWTHDKQVAFIDSLAANIYVPPLIFAVHREGDEEWRDTIDGKQRLTALCQFFQGYIYYKDAEFGKRYYYCRPDGVHHSRRAILPDEDREHLENLEIHCVEYENLDSSDEREIFRRVQMGVSLTPAEKMAVIDRSRARYARQLAEAHFSAGSTLSSPAFVWTSSRGADFRAICSAMMILGSFSTDATAHSPIPDASAIERWCKIASPLTNEPRDAIENALAALEAIVSHPRKHVKSVFTRIAPRMAPVEVVMALVLVAVHKGKTAEEHAGFIKGMRKDVRKKHIDIRSNNKVGRTMLEFIKRSKLVADAADAQKRKRQEGDTGVRQWTAGEGEEEVRELVTKRRRISV
ncbi:hypothetical protein EV715DRAFT_298051 [Schizophyllum commune]